MENSSDKAAPVPFYSVFPVPKNNRGHAFSHPSDMLAHLEGESTGHWLIGSNGMWHPGIHITDATTPWCALSGKAVQEVTQYPVPYKGEQAIRCMADGEVVAYRINRDYLAMPWMTGDLAYSTTFVLIRHRIQPGQTTASVLTFYTLYMHLAPWSAYPEESPLYKVADGQHLKAYVDDALLWTATTLKPGTRVSWNTADPAARMSAHGRQYARVSLVESITDKMSLNVGDRLWVVCDNCNLVPDSYGPVRPAWWANLLPPAKDTMQFDAVVCPTPYPIKAGEAIGHLGYYQAPTDGGSAGRYQVHIECFTADELPHFLTNPEGAGQDTPTFASYPNSAPRYLKSMSRDGAISAPQIDLTTNQTGIFALADSSRVVSDGVAYWQNGGEGWYLAESDLTMLSRYDLTARGFESTEANPTSFDHLDGVNQPQGLVRYIYQKLFDVSSKDPRTSHALVRYNYQRLLDKIDRREKHYSTQEYLQAVHNQSYLEHLQRLCVKHPADWYYAAEDPIWQTFFTPLFKKESPLWYRYSINFLTATRWMHLVPGMVAAPWYMHPLVFLDAISMPKTKSWAHSPFAKLLGSVESQNDYTAYNQVFQKPGRTVAKYHTNLTSMTIKQVMEKQMHSNVMFATGRFQIIPGTLVDAVKSLKLDVNSLYDEATQDRIFEEYLIKVKRPAIIAYLEGDGSVEDAIYDWAKEFASAGVRKGNTISKGQIAQEEGVSYYSGDGLNHAHLTPQQMVNILRETKNEFN